MEHDSHEPETLGCSSRTERRNLVQRRAMLAKHAKRVEVAESFSLCSLWANLSIQERNALGRLIVDHRAGRVTYSTSAE